MPSVVKKNNKGRYWAALGGYLAFWAVSFFVIMAVPQQTVHSQGYADFAEWTPVVLFLASLAIFALPLCTMLIRAIGAARDPMYRVTPTGPWFFFQREIRGRIGRAIPVWLLTFVGLSFVCFAIIFVEESQSRAAGAFGHSLIMTSEITLGLLGCWIVIYGCALLVAPYCRQIWMMAVVTSLAALFIFLAIDQFIDLVFPREWRYILWNRRDGGFTRATWSLYESGSGVTSRRLNAQTWEESMGLIQFYFLLPAGLFAAGAWYWVRRRGEQWLRLETDSRATGS